MTAPGLVEDFVIGVGGDVGGSQLVDGIIVRDASGTGVTGIDDVETITDNIVGETLS